MERCPFVRQRRCQTLAILRRSFKFQYRPTLLAAAGCEPVEFLDEHLGGDRALDQPADAFTGVFSLSAAFSNSASASRRLSAEFSRSSSWINQTGSGH